ncbi:uncharacterized protein LOC134214406 [Armigeres subalbatus]|uniref:uncharacterized protein LOC134214406 n=1 Tax=Armigeres subalbatus TaxID=124917 RepID=UPI002ED1E308
MHISAIKMKFFSQQCCLMVIFFASFVTTEQICQISDDELKKIDQILTHIEEPIYAVQDDNTETSDSDECAQMLNGIHFQLRRLTQRYKLMNKGYVKAEEFQKMAKDYEDQLTTLNRELEHLKAEAKSGLNLKMEALKKNIKELEQNVTLLHQDLRGIADEYGKVQKDLCLTYLESNQISKAKAKIKDIDSKYLMELVKQFSEISKGRFLSVLDLSAAIPDLDDRGQAYKTIFQILQTQHLLEGESSVLLEAEIQKLNATFKPETKITDERKKEIHNLLDMLSRHSSKALEQWTMNLNSSENSSIIKNAMDRMFLTQLDSFAKYITAYNYYHSTRNFVQLLALSSNYYKIAAYKRMIEEKVNQSLALIMIDMLSMEKTELKYDAHVPGEVEQLYDFTFELLPGSLKSIRSCLKNFKISNQDTNQCILATDEREEVKHPNLEKVMGHLKRVTLSINNCSTFRLEPSSDRTSLRIVTATGNALTNVNAALRNSEWFSRVGAPYSNNRGMQLDSSQDWILEANFENSSIKIESDFNVYQMGRNIDHLVVQHFNERPEVAVARYGFLGMRHGGVNEKRAEWKFECV